MTDPSATGADDPGRTQMLGSAPSIHATQTIQPVQCPVCKTFNPAGEAFCVECGLVFASALPDDVFGAPVVRLPCLVDETGREHHLRPGRNLVGREGDVLLTDPRVSRRHAEVSLQDGVVTVLDLGSTNGTYVNGERIEPVNPVTIEAGARVSFGGVELLLSMPGETSATMVAAGGRTMSMEAPPKVDAPAGKFVGDQGQEFALRRGENSLGRRPDNDIVIYDPYVSGSHAKIEVLDDGVYFTDVGSTNGTLLNGARLPANERVKIGPDDEIQLGKAVFRVVLNYEEPSGRGEDTKQLNTSEVD